MYNKIKTAYVLKQLGISPVLKGYRCLTCAIEFVDEDSTYLNGITKRLYPAVAKQLNTTASRVERAIRHAVETGWCRGNMDFQDDLFGYSIDSNKGKPTNGEFIATVVEWLEISKEELKVATE